MTSPVLSAGGVGGTHTIGAALLPCDPWFCDVASAAVLEFPTPECPGTLAQPVSVRGRWEAGGWCLCPLERVTLALPSVGGPLMVTGRGPLQKDFFFLV